METQGIESLFPAQEDIKCVDDAPTTMVHIKNTSRDDGFCRVYWNKKNSCVYTEKSVTDKASALSQVREYKEDFRLTEREVQVGDSVCYIFAIKHLPLLFCSITGIQFYKDKPYVYLEPNSTKAPTDPIWAEFIPKRFIFVADNRCATRDQIILDTEVFAMYRDELDIAEEIYAETRIRHFFVSYIEDDSKPIGEAAFKDCHLTLFKGIYKWAGKYRNEELVVQSDKRHTLHPDEISKDLKNFFSSLTRSQLRKIKDKNTLIKTLIDVHKELAWIHPFQDGNGRAIRLFLELLSITRGYKFNLEEFISTGRGKKSYYHAVRQSLHGNNVAIKKLFNLAIEELK